jgi:hypothetical protein
LFNNFFRHIILGGKINGTGNKVMPGSTILEQYNIAIQREMRKMFGHYTFPDLNLTLWSYWHSMGAVAQEKSNTIHLHEEKILSSYAHCEECWKD